MNIHSSAKFALVLCMIMGCGFCTEGFAEEPQLLDTPQQTKVYQTLVKEIRCITCPNQNIAESEGGFAKAVKADIYDRIRRGESASEIREALIKQYGDQIVYSPAMSPQNWILWWGPLGLSALGLALWWFSLRAARR